MLVPKAISPASAGMPARANVFVGRSPLFETSEGFKGSVIAKYPESGTILMSGYLEGEEHMRGKAAALDVHHGNGHVILIGFKPQWRGQPFGTFRCLSLLLSSTGRLQPEHRGHRVSGPPPIRAVRREESRCR